MNSFTIRREAEADIPAIRTLTSRAFEDKPYSRQREAEIVERLRDTDALTFSFMAVKGASLVGHIAATPVGMSDGAQGWFHIGPISVAPERQGEGIGSLLMQRALDELREMGAAGAVSVGDPAFLARFSFVDTPDLAIPLIDPQYFRALPLTGAQVPTGTVTYPAAFLG
ncbi:GNAT family N-acetyltransferase [Corynebacterium sp.]|uniref:GNAT family N-acetyltransferase n=1 Tax=Corynebacterium sp. TaxID=1720 RepID=UPI0026DF4095|nr:N-acetyltransferase [Corynebacterium sp.]MDO5513179.1 N-acetyltransferase [Corynebacterium sp.]